MSWDTLIDLVFSLFATKSEFASVALTNPSILLVLFFSTLLSIAGITARNQHYWLMFFSLSGAAVLAFAFITQQTSSFDLHSGRVFIGGDLPAPEGAAHVVAFDACQQICSTDSRCVAFTYDQTTRHCYPKAAITTMHAFATAISGIRRSRPGVTATR